jgi:hypothetical protein
MIEEMIEEQCERLLDPQYARSEKERCGRLAATTASFDGDSLLLCDQCADDVRYEQRKEGGPKTTFVPLLLFRRVMRNLPAELVTKLTNPFITTWLPVEVVMVGPNDPHVMDQQRQARAYNFHRWLINNQLVDYDELHRLPDFSGSTANYDKDRAWLLEQYSDHGDDGHTDYRLIGWRIDTLPEEVIKRHYHLTYPLPWWHEND